MALSLLQHVNGERAVVFLFVVRILVSTPLSLLPQAFSLSLLSLFALSVEISADDASNPLAQVFRTRPGASSGILLGAVTLPGLLISKLIQSRRAGSLKEVEIEEFEYLKLQYWAALASCAAVLIFLSLVCRRQGKRSTTNWNVIYSSICIISLVGSILLSLSGILYVVWSPALISLWVLSHGVAAVTLIQKILDVFPGCASTGESLLVTSGLVIYFGDMMAYTASKISYLASSKVVLFQNGFDRSEISTIIQGLFFGLLLFPLFYKYVLRALEYFVSLQINGDQASHEIRRSVVFCASLTFMLVVVVPSWMQFVHAFHMHPLLCSPSELVILLQITIWEKSQPSIVGQSTVEICSRRVVDFVLSEPWKRLTLCMYWLLIISLTVMLCYNTSKNSKTERIFLRKYYHLLAVAIFVPALLFQPKFLDLAFGAALAVFLVLEIIRIWKIWPIGHLVHQFMNAFTDHRDSDLLVVSHFSLLLGCAIPIWLSSGFTDRPFAPFAGILSLGIGDTMASLVGHKYGVLRWSKAGKKTIEGTAAGITSVLAACFALLPLLAAAGYIFTMHWFSLIVAVTTSGLLEAYTAQLDNAFIPLIFYSLLCL